MNNNFLCSFYYGLKNTVKTVNGEVTLSNLVETLNKTFDYSWTWEIADEKIVMNDTMVSTTVSVYVPGKMLTGRSICNIENYSTNHLRAILNAVSFILPISSFEEISNTNQVQQPVPQQPQQTEKSYEVFEPINNIQTQPNNPVQNNAQMTPDQIMAMVNNQQPIIQNSIPQQEQVHNQPQSTQVNQQVQNSQYDTPIPEKKGFSQRQLDRMANFKTSCNIINNDMLVNWINLWNSSYTRISDITPTNIDEFLTWAENKTNTILGEN